MRLMASCCGGPRVTSVVTTGPACHPAGRREPTVTDVTIDDTDQAIVRAVGEELRRARACVGWTRPELIRRMRTQIPVNTYAGYEQGIRQCSIPRLVEICEALGVTVPELLGLALQRLELDLDRSGILIDLHKIVGDEREELR